jgi:hypothetical protein
VPRQVTLPFRPPPPLSKSAEAFERLARERALHSLIRWALPLPLLRGLLKDAIPRRMEAEIPPEAWGSMAASLAMADPIFGGVVAQALHDRLGWDREPADIQELDRLCRERPLEALWMSALSDHKLVRKSFPRLAKECLRVYTASPSCSPPSWNFVEAAFDLQTRTARELDRVEKAAAEAQRNSEAERQRVEDLREELKRLRRENAELRGGRAEAERRAKALAAEAQAFAASNEVERVAELERRLRKTEKECEHLRCALERAQSGLERRQPPAPPLAAAGPSATAPANEPGPKVPPLSEGPNPRRRVVRHLLRRLLKKGKIGASHTHEDNVYRGVADHEKGLARQAVEVLRREGYLVLAHRPTDVPSSQPFGNWASI